MLYQKKELETKMSWNLDAVAKIVASEPKTLGLALAECSGVWKAEVLEGLKKFIKRMQICLTSR